MNGGPQLGSGRTPIEDRFWVRSRGVRVMFRPDEHADLCAIAEQWGVPVATAVWAIVSDQLARIRKRAPELGEHGLAIAAASVVLRQRLDRQQSSGDKRPSDQMT
jgi:hypothetical protein